VLDLEQRTLAPVLAHPGSGNAAASRGNLRLPRTATPPPRSGTSPSSARSRW
jgi:hypothetical protein